MSGPSLGDIGAIVNGAAAVITSLGVLWGALHVMVVAPLKRWQRSQIRAPLQRLEKRLDDHIRDHPGPVLRP